MDAFITEKNIKKVWRFLRSNNSGIGSIPPEVFDFIRDEALANLELIKIQENCYYSNNKLCDRSYHACNNCVNKGCTK